MNNEIQEHIILFAEKCKKMIGFNIKVNESISTNKDNFDRHFTTFSNEYSYFFIVQNLILL